MSSLIKSLVKKLPLSSSQRKALRRWLKPSWIYFLSQSTDPVGNYYGFDRGTPIDRYYIENFLVKNKQDIHGHCLEILNNHYTKKFGESRVTKSDILDIDPGNHDATIIDDLRKLTTVSDNTYDCIILTQVLQFIDNAEAAVAECHRILKPGGVILATLPALSRIDCISGTEGDFWRFTTAGALYLFKKHFAVDKLFVASQGNARIGINFYAGLAREETPEKVFVQNDPNFPLIVTVRAIK